MLPKKIWANLTVKDVQRTADFYKQLGCKTNVSAAGGLVCVYFAEEGFIINFFDPKTSDFNMFGKIADLQSGNEIMFSISAETELEVQEWETEAVKAGGKIFKPAGRDANGFYYCGFADPDGHKFNVLLMEEGM
jgi:uncharacterized protein